MSRRTAVVLAVAVLAVAGAIAAAVLVHGPAPSLSERAAAVSAGLKCPSCSGQSVADSQSPVAQSMRSEVRSQLRNGRSEDEIRAWFTHRYGDQVLLAPPRHGVALLLWLLPAGALLAGVTGWLALRRRPEPDRSSAIAARALSPRRAALAAGTALAVGIAVPVAFHTSDGTGGSAAGARPAATDRTAAQWVALADARESSQDFAGAITAYRHALRLSPGSAAVRTRLGFDLVRTGRPDDAIPLVDGLAGHRGPEQPMALLVLGLAQRAQDRPAAEQTLRRFLDVAPDHPAAAQVRRLLRQDRS